MNPIKTLRAKILGPIIVSLLTLVNLASAQLLPDVKNNDKYAHNGNLQSMFGDLDHRVCESSTNSSGCYAVATVTFVGDRSAVLESPQLDYAGAAIELMSEQIIVKIMHSNYYMTRIDFTL